jgi:hypothetical protein
MLLTLFDTYQVESIKYEASVSFAYLEIEYNNYPSDWDGLCLSLLNAGETFNGFNEYEFFYYRPVNSVPYDRDGNPILFDTDDNSLYGLNELDTFADRVTTDSGTVGDDTTLEEIHTALREEELWGTWDAHEPELSSTFRKQLDTKRVSLSKTTDDKKDLYVAPYYQINGKRYIGKVVKIADIETGVNFINIADELDVEWDNIADTNSTKPVDNATKTAIVSDVLTINDSATDVKTSEKVRQEIEEDDIPPMVYDLINHLQSRVLELEATDKSIEVYTDDLNSGAKVNVTTRVDSMTGKNFIEITSVSSAEGTYSVTLTLSEYQTDNVGLTQIYWKTDNIIKGKSEVSAYIQVDSESEVKYEAGDFIDLEDKDTIKIRLLLESLDRTANPQVRELKVFFYEAVA